MNITGSLIEAYIFCPRQAWLMVRELSGNQYNEFLQIGRLISEESFKREKKEIDTKSGKIDIVKKENGELILIEVKKSSKFIEPARMQLLYYIFKMKHKGYSVKGEIHIPRQKKIIKIELTNQEEKKLEKTIQELKETIYKNLPPVVEKTGKCNNCSYNEFCWS